MSERAFTPSGLAKRYGVGVGKILTLIRTGELAAINLASATSSRPQWKIMPEALAAFEARRSAKPMPVRTPRRKRKLPTDVIEFF